MNNKLKTISTNTLIIGMGAIVSKGAAFIIAFVLANFLSTKQYGSLDVILTYVSLALPFITMELSQAMYRKILENPENANEYFEIQYIRYKFVKFSFNTYRILLNILTSKK